MAIQHQVAAGDTILRIAARHGIVRWELIWDDPANADLRARRVHPQILLPGDVVHVPAPQPGSVACETDRRHVFRKLAPRAFFCVYLKDHAGRPYAGHRYHLELGDQRHDGTTGRDGRVEHVMPIDVKSARLTLQRSDDPADRCTWSVEVAHLQPVEATAGAQARLNNLGYKAGEADGALSEPTRAAIRTLQMHLGRDDPDGELDASTLAALRDQQYDL